MDSPTTQCHDPPACPSSISRLKKSPQRRKPVRALSYQEGERAKKMENPGTRGPIENAARRYQVLAEKLEAARQR